MIYKKGMERLMANYSDEVRQSLGKPIANEWAFVTTYDGVEMIGEIDKIVEKDGHIHLYDFKTNNVRVRSSQEWLDYYKPQLYLYSYAYEKETKKAVASASLYLFNDREKPIHTLSFKKEEEEKVLSAIKRLIALRQKEAGRQEYIEAKTK